MAEHNDKAESRNGQKRRLTPAAERALAEADERRSQEAVRAKKIQPREIGGRGGEDPVRYGDWEVEGLARDF